MKRLRIFFIACATILALVTSAFAVPSARSPSSKPRVPSHLAATAMVFTITGHAVASSVASQGDEPLAAPRSDTPLQANADAPVPVSPKERAWLARLPILRVGIDPTAEPLSFRAKDGSVQGIADDYLRDVASVLGVRTRLVSAVDWSETVSLASSGEIDWLSAASPHNDALGKRFDFTESYLELPVMIVMREDAASVAGPADLGGRRVSANLAQGAVAKAVAAMRAIDVVPVASTAEGLAAVASGRADAYIGDIATAEVLIRRHYAARLKLAAPAGEFATVAMAVDRRYAPLVPLLNRVLARMPERRVQQIRNTWLRSDYAWGGSWQAIARKVGPAGIAVLLLLLIVTHAYVRLRRETRRRRESETQLTDVTAHMPAVVYRFRHHAGGKIEFTFVAGNPEPMFGIPACTFVDDERRAFATIDARDQPVVLADVTRAATAMSTLHSEMRIRDTVPERWIASHAVPRRVDGAVEFTGYWIDVSDRRMQSLQLAAAKEAAEAATRAKTQFLATMSHEIRTPMHGVIGMLEMLGGTSLDTTQREVLATAGTSAEALLQILDDILDLSRIEAGRLVIEPTVVDLRALCTSVMALFGWQAGQKGLLLVTDIDARLARAARIDGVRLRQILLNLASNAIKFTSQGAVTLSVAVVDERASVQRVRLSVIDTGIGMAPDDIGRLFTPFTQVAATTHRFGGSGLGLAISHRLVDLLGGRIAITSEPGQGTRVDVELDLVVEQADTPPALATTSHIVSTAAVALDVLVAEDNPTNRVLVSAQLDRLGHRHTIVEDGRRALAAAGDASFDVLLTDLHMPHMDGIALATQLRARGANLRIVAMTANAMPGEAERCRAAGMDGFLVKPVRLAELRAALDGRERVDRILDLDALRADFGSLAPVPAMVARFAEATRDDVRAAGRLRTPTEAAAWIHRISGGLRMFGASTMTARAERLEHALRGPHADSAMRGIPDTVAALELFLSRIEAEADALNEG